MPSRSCMWTTSDWGRGRASSTGRLKERAETTTGLTIRSRSTVYSCRATRAGRPTPSFTYTCREGAVTVENATEEVVEGRFDLEAATGMAVHHDSLRVFIDFARTRDRGEFGNAPMPPPVSFEDLDPPMTVSGDFTATPEAFDDGVVPIN